jgi:transcriptional regulator with XRE-family HTH domain
MSNDDSTASQIALEMAQAFGSIIRSRRRALNLRQNQLALATGVGRRFLIELEAGKPSCQLGRSLLVAHALGLTSANILSSGAKAQSSASVDLPDITQDVEEPNVASSHLL